MRKKYLVMFLTCMITGSSSPATFTVTNTKDDGLAGSLRWALQEAGSHLGPDTVAFSIPIGDAGFNSQYWTIAPGSPLPDINSPGTVINGVTQAWNVGDFNPFGPEILLDGRTAGPSTAGLQITGPYNEISGLSVCGFSHCGIFLFGSGAHDNRINFCYIGISPDGVSAIPNHIGIILSLGAGQNMIGIPSALDRNIISGNETYGIEIYQAHGNAIVNNLIGTNNTGTAARGNGWAGVWIAGASTGNMIGDWAENAGNLVSGNGYYGILISEEGTRNNTVRQNQIGTDFKGLDRIENGTAGVCINEKARANIIDEKNIISGNYYGLIIKDAGTDSNRVSGNWIGLDATGTDTLPNLLHGLRIENGARYNVIGGAGEGFRNIVSGNGWSGLGTVGDSTAYNTFAHNWCGLDVSGTKDLGNNYYGAHFGGLANHFSNNYFCGNRCGVVMSGYSEKCVLQENCIGIRPDGNAVIPNDEGGVRIQDNAYQDTLRFNQIVGNTGWGVELKGIQPRKITLSQNSITMNEMGGILLAEDANEGVSPPSVQQADPGTGRVLGYSSPLNRVELFEDTGNQGKTFLGQTIADADGNWEWEGLFAGPNVTVTSTDAEGNTSAFSAPYAIPSGVLDLDAAIPGRFALYPNYPNPFNPATTLDFDLPQSTEVTIDIVDITGRQIVTLAKGKYDAGQHSVKWNGAAEAGLPVPSGIYFCRLKTGAGMLVQKMTVLR